MLCVSSQLKGAGLSRLPPGAAVGEVLDREHNHEGSHTPPSPALVPGRDASVVGRGFVMSGYYIKILKIYLDNAVSIRQ
jgi:hypothetical protein